MRPWRPLIVLSFNITCRLDSLPSPPYNGLRFCHRIPIRSDSRLYAGSAHHAVGSGRLGPVMMHVAPAGICCAARAKPAHAISNRLKKMVLKKQAALNMP
jgi:hypothetical protein